MSVKVYLLGITGLEKAGRPLKLDTRKAIALFAYLLVTGRSYNRDTLATFLWPDSDQSGARGALRRTLSSLRKALGEEYLETNRDQVGLKELVSVDCDAIHFREMIKQVQSHNHSPGNLCASCLEKYTNALKLYRGDFMAGFSLRDSINFDNWQFSETDQFRRELANVLVALCETYSARGLYQNAQNYCRRWLALDPLNETAHRQLMKLYAFSGQREIALRQYRECVRILDTEIGVPPLEETTRLYEEIKLNKIIAPEKRETSPGNRTIDPVISGQSEKQPVLSPPGTDAAHLPVMNFPIIGRKWELAELTAFYSGIQSDGYFAAVVGEAGIGKTRFVEEFLNTLKSKDISPVSARCYAGEQDLAYSLFSDLLKVGVESISDPEWWRTIPVFYLAEASRLVPQISELSADISSISLMEGPGAQGRFFEGVSQVLIKLVTQNNSSQPGVIFLDDLQWIDSASMDLLTFIIRRLTGNPLLILASWQNDQAENVNRLKALIAPLTRDRRSLLISLKPLDRAQAFELIEVAGRHLSIQKDQARFKDNLLTVWGPQLVEETGGNPFFLTAYLQAIHRKEIIPSQGKLSPPETVREMIQTRISFLSAASKQVLQTAAVTGRSFDYQTLLEASGRAEEEVINSIEELLSRGFIHEIPAQRYLGIEYDFSHEIIRNIICEGISLARIRLLHRRIAESMEHRLHNRWNLVSNDSGKSLKGQIAGMIAHHYLQAGDMLVAASYLRQAGEYEKALFANADALTHLNEALALGHPDRAGIYIQIGELQVLEGIYTTAIQSYQNAAAQLNLPDTQSMGYETQPASSRIMLAQVEWKIGQVYERLGEWEHALMQFESALSVLGDENQILKARFLVDQSLAHYQAGNLLQAELISEQALQEAGLARDILAQAQAHKMIGLLKRSRNNSQQAIEYLNTSLVLADQLPAPEVRVAALNNLAFAYQDLQEYHVAIELVNQALAICLAQGDRHREAALRNHLADLYQKLGSQDEAMEQLKLAVIIFAEIGENTGQWQPEIWKLVEW